MKDELELLLRWLVSLSDPSRKRLDIVWMKGNSLVKLSVNFRGCSFNLRKKQWRSKPPDYLFTMLLDWKKRDFRSSRKLLLPSSTVIFIHDEKCSPWIASQVAQRVSGLSIEQMGGVGFTRELGIEKYWRFVPATSICWRCLVILRLERFMKVLIKLLAWLIFLGTSNIQMDTIFRQLQKQYGARSWLLSASHVFSYFFFTSVS